MNATILAVGDELISGQTVDTNSAYLASRLEERGIVAVAHWTIGDDQARIAAAIIRSAETTGLVLVTGGLGPTADDLTRGALADAMGCELVLHEACLAEIESFFRRRGRTMVPINRVQAMIPAGAEPLANPIGTAAGIAATVGKARVFVMPGVPAEMRRMYQHVVAQRLGVEVGAIVRRGVLTFGRGEAEIAFSKNASAGSIRPSARASSPSA